MAAAQIRVASYNVHAGVGNDGRFDPARIAAVVAELGADVVGLQEVHLGGGASNMLGPIGEATGMHIVACPTLTRPAHGEFGNALLTRHPVISVRQLDLGVAGREPRAALDVVVDCGYPLRVLATHLGLRPWERREQVAKLLQALTEDEGAQGEMTTVLLGDINEWFLWGRALRWLHRHFRSLPARRTFPSGWPVFALDRIWVKPFSLVRRVQAHRSPAARLASDHLPLIADIGRVRPERPGVVAG
jgi:endonuclease/exonuclease/phosphatase family metal-dependent hydrolase